MDIKSKKSTASNNASSKKIVCIYAQNDESFYQQLQTYLSLWQRERYIQWLETPAGSNVEHTLQTHIQQADLILLFISADFFAQDHCYTAMKASLQEQARRQVPVIPILVRASAWKESACSSLHALPDNEQPIAQWTYPEQAYENIRARLVYIIPGDRNFQQKLMQKTALAGTGPTSTNEHKEAQKPQSGSVNIANVASNNGQIGNFYAPINNNRH